MREVSVDTAAEMIEGGAYALDVREREEFAGGHVPGAVNIPMGQLAGRLDEVDRDRPVVVICRSGNRSDAMADVFLPEWALPAQPFRTNELVARLPLPQRHSAGRSAGCRPVRYLLGRAPDI